MRACGTCFGGFYPENIEPNVCETDYLIDWDGVTQVPDDFGWNFKVRHVCVNLALEGQTLLGVIV